MRYGAAVALAFICFVLGAPAFASVARIEVTARISHTNTARLAPVGRAGDADSSFWVVRDRHAHAIGEMVFDCRWITSGLRLCLGQLQLPLGTIALIGTSQTRFLGQFAVVGGSGRYIGADGSLLFSATGTGRYLLSIIYRKGRT